MLYYEFGYTIHSNGETQETILGVCPENEKDKKQREINITNQNEQTPDIRGSISETPAHWWLRPSDIVTPNVFRCSLCNGIVDKHKHCFQCRDCKAMGDFTTGIMSQMLK